jgi:hypothetical protein
VRAPTTIAANTATAISRNHVREPKPREAAFGGDACEGCCATRPYLDGLFARFRFLAKAIDDAQVGARSATRDKCRGDFMISALGRLLHPPSGPRSIVGHRFDDLIRGFLGQTAGG